MLFCSLKKNKINFEETSVDKPYITATNKPMITGTDKNNKNIRKYSFEYFVNLSSIFICLYFSI
jgi:hypothetical protein